MTRSNYRLDLRGSYQVLCHHPSLCLLRDVFLQNLINGHTYDLQPINRLGWLQLTQAVTREQNPLPVPLASTNLINPSAPASTLHWPLSSKSFLSWTRSSPHPLLLLLLWMWYLWTKNKSSFLSTSHLTNQLLLRWYRALKLVKVELKCPISYLSTSPTTLFYIRALYLQATIPCCHAMHLVSTLCPSIPWHHYNEDPTTSSN